MSGRGFELAYRYLNRRDRTVTEVRRHLVNREIDPAEADAVVAELLETGALDDARFAQLFVDDKRSLQDWGAERIRRGLEARGLETELIAEALDGESELDRALTVLRRRFPAPPRDRRDRERALGVLLRKGYEYELAVDALGQHCAPG